MLCVPIQKTLSYDNYKIYCKNFAVNAILNYYGEEALKYYIDYDVVCNLDETLPVSEAELCALIGNLIENAVECCKNITGKNCFCYSLRRKKRRNGKISLYRWCIFCICSFVWIAFSIHRCKRQSSFSCFLVYCADMHTKSITHIISCDFSASPT